MTPSRNSLLVVAAILGVSSACAQITPNDPYNPQTKRNPTPTIQPSLADMGFGTDEGNIGPFVTNTDKQYAQAMAARGIMEIRLGQAAMDKSERADVKAVAQRMIKDYLLWDSGMEKAAARLAIPLPKDVDGKDKAEMDRVLALSGPAFDQAYLKEVIRLQQKALSLSHHEASNAAVSGFRHWAGVVLPQLTDQIHEAQKTLAASSTVSIK
jgi:predicted outer membrane protein